MVIFTIGCCDVLLDKDVNGVKLVSELCTTVLKSSDKYSGNFYLSTNRLNKDAVKYCRSVILETCDIDINALLKDTIALDLKYKNVLVDIRTFNKSLCLKYHFDITLDLLGTPHRVKKFNISTPTSKNQTFSMVCELKCSNTFSRVCVVLLIQFELFVS